jgi:tetratricopeptide (TPR) repeat protein
MKSRMAAGFAATLFVAGIGIGYAAQKVAPSLFHGKSKEEAARALLDVARVQAGDGSWDRIAIGRVLYLGGHKAEGQAMFDAMLADDHEDSDEFRIARVYREAGEWAKAKPLFDRFVAGNPKDEKGLAEIGAYYLLAGDRDTAERFFERSFATSAEVWATVGAAGAYLGVVPEE